MPRFRTAALLLVALAAAGAPSAQTTVSVSGGRAVLSGFGGPGAVAGAGASLAVTPAVDVEVAIQGVRSVEDTEAALLFRSDATWHVRRHALATLGATAYPVRVRALGAGHRLGVGAALAGRRRVDRLHQGTFSPLFYEPLEPGAIDEMAAEWEALGPGYEARVIAAEAAGMGTVAGDHLALLYPSEAWEVGGSVGVAYEVEVRGAVLGVRADYRRFLNQRVSEGTNALDLTVRLGARF